MPLRGMGFHALSHTQFRHLWLGQVTTTTAQFMDVVTRGWLIYSMTGSAIHLALVMALRALPLLVFGLFAGVLADRVDRKLLLMVTQWWNLALNLLMGVLLVMGWMEVWIVYATSVGAGLAMALQQPARNAMIPASVPPAALQNAVVLNSATLNIGQALGPTVGGLLIGLSGIASTFFLQAVLFGASVLVTTGLTRATSIPPRREHPDSMGRSLVEGFRYVRGNRLVLMLLVLAMIPMFFGNPVQSVLPLFAEDVLSAGPEGAGMLLGALGVGALASTAVLMFLPTLHQAGRVVIVATFLYGIVIICFALSDVYWLSVSLMFVSGVCLSTFRTLNHAMISRYTDRAYLGRVNSLYLLDRGLIPLGTVLLGALTEVMGVSHATASMALTCVLLTVVTSLRAGAMWHIRQLSADHTPLAQGAQAGAAGPAARRPAMAVDADDS